MIKTNNTTKRNHKFQIFHIQSKMHQIFIFNTHVFCIYVWNIILDDDLPNINAWYKRDSINVYSCDSK